jgi:putative ABC transport system substrate-binding protein
MKRREFIALIGAAAAWPLTASAQQAAKISHIGYLVGSLRTDPHLSDAFLERLHELGYVDGGNLTIEYRDADGQLDRLPGLAAELVRLDLHLIFTASSVGPRAVQQATSTIPIVCPVIGDPVGDGLAVSLARPGGNVTGLTSLYPGLIPKRLQVLKEMVPGIRRVAILQEPGILGEATNSILLNETEHAARSLGVQVKFLYARNVDELDEAFSKISSEHADALIPFGGTLIYIERKRLVDFAAKSQAANDVQHQGACGTWRPHSLRRKSSRLVQEGSGLRR